jgi:hypothetical protein
MKGLVNLVNFVPTGKISISKISSKNYFDVKSVLQKHSKSLTFEFHLLSIQLNAYVDQLANEYPFVQSVSIGKSYQNRDMRIAQITKAGPGKQNVWIEAGLTKRLN